MNTAVITILAIMYITEAFTDFFIIKNQKANNTNSRKWHNFDLGFHFLIMLLILVLSNNNIGYAILLITSRWLFFNTILNWLRGKELWYRGSKEPKLIQKFSFSLWLTSIFAYIINLYYLLH